MHLPFRAFTFLSTAVIVYVASSMAAPILITEQLHSGRLFSVGNSVPQSDVLQLKEIKLEALRRRSMRHVFVRSTSLCILTCYTIFRMYGTKATRQGLIIGSKLLVRATFFFVSVEMFTVGTSRLLLLL